MFFLRAGGRLLSKTIDIAEEKKSLKQTIKWLVPYIVLFLVLTGLLMCYRIVVVDGNSMLDTYQNGDIVLVNSIGYLLDDKDLERGTIVVIKPTGELQTTLIKRVIAVGGDELFIDFEQGIVQINGTTITEDYIKEPTHLDGGAYEYPLTIPEGHYFVMGDNRNASNDSRNPYIGCVPKDDIMGAVMFAVPNVFQGDKK